MNDNILKEKISANAKIYDAGIKRLYILNLYANKVGENCPLTVKNEIFNLRLFLSYIKPNDITDYANKGFTKMNNVVIAKWQYDSLYPSPKEFLTKLASLNEINSKIITIYEKVTMPRFDFVKATEQVNTIDNYKDLIYFEGFLLQDLSFNVLTEDLEKESELMKLIASKKQELYMSLGRTKKL